MYYVARQFPATIGDDSTFIFPVTYDDANNWLDDFLQRKFALFGAYEDAMDINHPFLFHSILSPLLNCGLLTPSEVINKAISFAEKHTVPIESLEGFLHQIIGWREYMRAIYILKPEMSHANFFNHTNMLSARFYSANTGLEPVDHVIRSVQKYAYAYHIERLMVMGNILLLCCIDPKEVYRWFMEFFIDAYDWVMVPNVYGMSQYAAGNIMTTKPYFSSSRYILSMSNFKKGLWCDIWDALYWTFIYEKREIISKNPRLAIMVSMLAKKSPAQLNNMLRIAKEYRKSL